MAHKKGVGSSKNGRIGKDDTLYALVDGVVNFHKGRRNKSVVSVIPETEA